MLRDLEDRNTWGQGHDNWIAGLLPNSEPLLIEDLSGDLLLVLGVCAGTSVLTWPVTWVR